MRIYHGKRKESIRQMTCWYENPYIIVAFTENTLAWLSLLFELVIEMPSALCIRRESDKRLDIVFNFMMP